MRSQSAQFRAIGLQDKPRKKRPAVPTVNLQVSAGAAKKQRSSTGAQIPRGFVTVLAQESKYFDVAFAVFAANTTGDIRHIDPITQGDAVTQRQGKSWQNRNIQIRGKLTADTASIMTHVAMYLVWDRQPNKALATIVDVLDTVAPTSFMRRENKGRFLTIKKWQRAVIGNSTAPATGREMAIIDKWVKLPEECVAQCTAADTTGAIGNRVTGALLFLTLSDVVSGNTDASFGVQFRIGFKDS